MLILVSSRLFSQIVVTYELSWTCRVTLLSVTVLCSNVWKIQVLMLIFFIVKYPSSFILLIFKSYRLRKLAHVLLIPNSIFNLMVTVINLENLCLGVLKVFSFSFFNPLWLHREFYGAFYVSKLIVLIDYLRSSGNFRLIGGWVLVYHALYCIRIDD